MDPSLNPHDAQGLVRTLIAASGAEASAEEIEAASRAFPALLAALETLRSIDVSEVALEWDLDPSRAPSNGPAAVRS